MVEERKREEIVLYNAFFYKVYVMPTNASEYMWMNLTLAH